VANIGTSALGVGSAHLLALIPLLAAAYGVVLGAAAVVTGWPLLTGRAARWDRRRRAVVPPEGTAEDGAGAGSR
jgi:hypothetical protein